ncbi:substrate-binding domain-containing protein, partial [Frankia sp. Ag45/Mut15]|nr:substrate-binding domain-containing protein [Frankia umida]
TPRVGRRLSVKQENLSARVGIPGLQTGEDVNPKGSVAAVGDLDRIGRQSRDGAPPLLAMSGGPATEKYGSLVGRAIGVNVLAIVVNRRVGIADLTTAQVQGIFEGRFRNWSELGGANWPITIVGRNADSGTRFSLERQILHHIERLPTSSTDCRAPDKDPAAVVARCEKPDVGSLLAAVNEIPGAIGYSGVATVAEYANILMTRLNGVTPDIAFVRKHTYSFWSVEYFYSYGQPRGDTLAASFLYYLSLGKANSILNRYGYPSCVDPRNREFCHE